MRLESGSRGSRVGIPNALDAEKSGKRSKLELYCKNNALQYENCCPTSTDCKKGPSVFSVLVSEISHENMSQTLSNKTVLLRKST